MTLDGGKKNEIKLIFLFNVWIIFLYFVQRKDEFQY